MDGFRFGSTKLKISVVAETVESLIDLIDRNMGNVASVSVQKLRLNLPPSEVGRVLGLLSRLGMLEPVAYHPKNPKRYLIYRSKRKDLVRMLMEIRVSEQS